MLHDFYFYFYLNFVFFDLTTIGVDGGSEPLQCCNFFIVKSSTLLAHTWQHGGEGDQEEHRRQRLTYF